MAGRIRDEDIATIRERSPIDEVVGEYLQLRSAGGGSLKGLCPFHDEKTPSFNVTPARGHALPGAVAALTAVEALGAGAAVQSVLTGNVRPVAEAKLAAFGLDGYLDLAIGAYGEEHEVRAELVHLARDRAAAGYGRDFGGPATVLVGDTPLDVAAAAESGARSVAVATGGSTAAELAAAGADRVLPDLTDTGAFLAALAPPATARPADSTAR